MATSGPQPAVSESFFASFFSKKEVLPYLRDTVGGVCSLMIGTVEPDWAQGLNWVIFFPQR
jgi:hypothetical protein